MFTSGSASTVMVHEIIGMHYNGARAQALIVSIICLICWQLEAYSGGRGRKFRLTL